MNNSTFKMDLISSGGSKNKLLKSIQSEDDEEDFNN